MINRLKITLTDGLFFESSMSLICDDRENSVHRFLTGKPGVKIMRLNNSDYSILTNSVNSPRLVAAFERKSLADFGASIRDGRTANIQNLLMLRRETGCLLYYIVEGPANPSSTHEFGGVKYSSIRSSFLHLQTQFGVSILFTMNAADTATKLLEMLQSFCARDAFDQSITEGIRDGLIVLEDEPIVQKIDGKWVIQLPAAKSIEVPPSTSEPPPTIDQVYDTAPPHDAEKLLMIKIAKTDEENRMKLWMSLPYIGATTARILSNRPIMDYLRDSKLLIELGLGTRINQSLRALFDSSWNIEQKHFLAAMKGVGKTRQGQIIAKYSCLMNAYKAGNSSVVEGLKV